MQYTYLGSTGMEVSRLCFGTMAFGGRADKATSQAMYSACREAGINFFDCANVYQKGVAEEYLGEFMAGERDKVVITTKGTSVMANEPNQRGSGRKHLSRSLEASLRRLKTDYIDLYFIHHFDSHTALEEIMRTLDLFISQGKVLSVGVSNFAAWQVEKSLRIADVKGLTPIHCLEPMYNIVKRQAEVEILPMAKAEGLGVITYSPLGGGLLTGRYNTADSQRAGRLVDNPTYRTRYGGDWYLEAAANVVELAKHKDVHPASLALAWVASHPAVTAPIIGAADLEQLKPALVALDVVMDGETLAEIDRFSPPPPPANDRSEVKAAR